MISVGIDIAKDKHECFIINSEGVVLADVFTIPNNMEGLSSLLNKLRVCSTQQDSIKVGLEATGHYSYNNLQNIKNKSQYVREISGAGGYRFPCAVP